MTDTIDLGKQKPDVQKIQDLAKNLSNEIQSKLQIEDKLKKITDSNDIQQTQSSLDSLLKSISESILEQWINTEDKKILEQMKSETEAQLKPFKDALVSLQSQIQSGSVYTVDEELIKKWFWEQKSEWLFWPIKDYLIWILHNVEKWFKWVLIWAGVYKSSFDQSKISWFFEKTWYWDSSVVKSILWRIKSIKYQDFSKEVEKRNAENSWWFGSTLDWFHDFLNFLPWVDWAKRFTQEEKNVLPRIMDFIFINKSFIDSKLQWKSDATMEDVFQSIFSNDFTDKLRNHAIPAEWVKYKKYDKNWNVDNVAAIDAKDLIADIQKWTSKEIDIKWDKVSVSISQLGKLTFNIKWKNYYINRIIDSEWNATNFNDSSIEINYVKITKKDVFMNWWYYLNIRGIGKTQVKSKEIHFSYSMLENLYDNVISNKLVSNIDWQNVEISEA